MFFSDFISDIFAKFPVQSLGLVQKVMVQTSGFQPQ